MPNPGPTLTDRLVSLAHSAWLIPILFIVEIAETTIIPWPYEVAFVALCLAARDRIWLFILVTVLGSAAAGAIMYSLGVYFADPVSSWFGVQEAMADYRQRFASEGMSFILLGGATPVPSHLINLAAGASHYPFWTFILLFSASRFARFALLGGLIWLFGNRFIGLWDRMPVGWRRLLASLFLIFVVYLTVSSFAGD